LHIDIPADRVLFKSGRPIDSTRIVRETAVGLEGTVSALELIDLSSLEVNGELAEWTASIGRSLRAITKVHRQLKGTVNDGD
jgi:hypothetical protein